MTEYNTDNIVNFGAYEKAQKSSGSNDDGSNLEKRLSAVEHKMDILVKDSAELKINMKTLQESSSSIKSAMAEIKGRLMNMPTTLQWLGIITAMIFTIMAASFTLIRFGLPH